jgi:hypothetical protein
MTEVPMSAVYLPALSIVAPATRVATEFGLGLGLFYGVQKFFATVEDKLNEDAKVEIALRILDVERPPTRKGWASAFVAMFDTVFGANHLSLKCFARSALVTFCTLLTLNLYMTGISKLEAVAFASQILGNIIPDYMSLIGSRYLVGTLSRRTSIMRRILIVSGTAALGWVLAPVAFLVSNTIYEYWDGPAPGILGLRDTLLILPCYFASLLASIWFWLLVTSGLLIRATLRLPFAIPLLNRRFDIERKPLQCLGLMAGGVAAVCYWVWPVVAVIL